MSSASLEGAFPPASPQIPIDELPTHLTTIELNDLILERCRDSNLDFFDKASREQFIRSLLNDIREMGGTDSKSSEEVLQFRIDGVLMNTIQQKGSSRKGMWNSKELNERLIQFLDRMSLQQIANPVTLENLIEIWIKNNGTHFPRGTKCETIRNIAKNFLNDNKGIKKRLGKGSILKKETGETEEEIKKKKVDYINMTQGVYYYPDQPPKELNQTGFVDAARLIRETEEKKPKKGGTPDHQEKFIAFWKDVDLPKDLLEAQHVTMDLKKIKDPKKAQRAEHINVKKEQHVFDLVDAYLYSGIEKRKTKLKKNELITLAKSCIKFYNNEAYKHEFSRWVRETRDKYLEGSQKQPGIFDLEEGLAFKSSFLERIQKITVIEDNPSEEFMEMLSVYQHILADLFYQNFCTAQNIFTTSCPEGLDALALKIEEIETLWLLKGYSTCEVEELVEEEIPEPEGMMPSLTLESWSLETAPQEETIEDHGESSHSFSKTPHVGRRSLAPVEDEIEDM